MSSADAPDQFDSVTQSRVPAAGAPPVATATPNSVFALGQAAASEPAGEEAADMSDLEAQTLELLTKGDLSTKRIADALGVGVATAKKLTTRLQKGRKVWRVGKGPATRFSLAKGGFQGWLLKKGTPAPATSTSRPPPKEKRPAKAVARAVAPVAPPAAPPAPAVAPEITCGLFSNGEIQIDIPDEQLRLNREQTRYLIDWLFKVDNVLREVRA